MNLLYSILVLLQPGSCCNILHTVAKKNLEAFLISESSGQPEYYCARCCVKHFAHMITFKAHRNPMRLLPLFFRPETEPKSQFIFSVIPQVTGSCRTGSLICLIPRCILLSTLAYLLSASAGFTLCRHSPWPSQGRKELVTTAAQFSAHSPEVQSSVFICCKYKQQDEAHFDHTCQRSHISLCCVGQQVRACLWYIFWFLLLLSGRTFLPFQLLIASGTIQFLQCDAKEEKVLTESSGKYYLSQRGAPQIGY